MKKACISAKLTNSKRAIAKGLLVAFVTFTFFLTQDLAFPQAASAYPFWAQQTAPETPREATGRIVCANCHLAAKPTEVEIPQSVKPDTVFEAVVKIPYDKSAQELLGDGSKGGLQVGAVLMLPEGFKIAPEDRIPEELKEKTQGVYVQKYKEDQDNVVIVGPLPGDQYQEIVFPVLSPDPRTDKSVAFGKYSVHVGGNRGRGQLYPTGEKSNNNIYTASVAGNISQVSTVEGGGYQITIQPESGDATVEAIPAGLELVVAEGQTVKTGDALTNNPNVGGFGQVDGEIVLQDPARIQGLIVFLVAVMLSQVMLILKKKQVEKVQAAEMDL
jgi:apocytochrome f